MIKACAAAGIVLGFVFLGCTSNVANLSHFPSGSRVDFAGIDSLQDKGTKPHRFFYNCNFENDYLIKLAESDRDRVLKRIKYAFIRNGFNVSATRDGLVIAERGLTPFEWRTIGVVYFKEGNGFTYLYLRTEISQDFTCGPEINRAEGILNGICGQKDSCLEAKELTEETKRRVWPKQIEDGGLQAEGRGER